MQYSTLSVSRDSTNPEDCTYDTNGLRVYSIPLCWLGEINRLYSDLSTLKFLAVKFMVDKANEPVDLTLLVKADKEE